MQPTMNNVPLITSYGEENIYKNIPFVTDYYGFGTTSNFGASWSVPLLESTQNALEIA